jgi:hypothetical protein
MPGCGCKGGLFNPPGVQAVVPADQAARAKNRMTALVGGEPQRRWSGPLRPAKQPKAE